MADHETKQLVIFGTSNILSDIVDCALANGLSVSKIVTHQAEATGERDLSLAARMAIWRTQGIRPEVVAFDDFQPAPNEQYVLGPTTPTRAVMATALREKFDLSYCRLIHPRAYVSPMASIAEGVFVGANSVIGPGAVLAQHVFINRGVTFGHDTHIGAFSRVQPGSNIGGLSHIGHSVTIAIGATLLERLVIGDHAFIGAGAVVTGDVEAGALMLGAPARFKKSMLPP
ncbi:hypothetical protein [Undibacterium sp. TJN19]|uniref:hypothetical protein n=1 Tax=Undibacterium sp. TJN19 TaxID=3413055 RepID=UPI003BF3E761